VVSKHYRANLDRVAAEAFDGETVIVHFEQGTYFSLRGAAVDIWSLLSKSAASVDALVGAFDAASEGEPIRAEVERTLAELAESDLVSEADPAEAMLTAGGRRAAFTAPVVESFTDLKELIALDPVHEVDQAAGWPVRPPAF
jgi:Coenzyme PQQ synthesis protein D (PqqD)